MAKEIKRKFIGNAVSYQKARPNYPEELFSTLLQFWEQTSNGINNPIVVDVGCGTGIATRGIYLASQKKCNVIGVEPDLNMLEQAKRETAEKNIVYVAGSAEKLPLEKNSIDIMIAALAMQYFNRPLFYSETKRVLRKNGVIAIIENNRNWKENPFLEKYESFLEKNSYDKNVKYYNRDYRAYPFLDELNIYFQNATEQAFPWSKKCSRKIFGK
ncbi:class I SAM-dependent methyltransferase [Legionella gresilensis]|uniref:class I SAM-dependent methyltransferase n=1 Tax=Legionella gresilensis TaxID=91823 RepID=UPI00104194D2|nr:class I SAM-dependent methyltransferase [Legionella gresilensis]